MHHPMMTLAPLILGVDDYAHGVNVISFLDKQCPQRLALNLNHRTILGGLRTQSIGVSNLCSAFWTR
jgi:hypothetical protein